MVNEEKRGEILDRLINGVVKFEEEEVKKASQEALAVEGDH